MAQSVRQQRGKSTTARKVKRTLSAGQVHVFASFNNTIVTITDPQGNTVCWGSSGSAGFKGSRKSTPFAARLAAEQAIKVAMAMGMQEVDLIVKGPGPGRESAIRAVQSMGLKVRAGLHLCADRPAFRQRLPPGKDRPAQVLNYRRMLCRQVTRFAWILLHVVKLGIPAIPLQEQLPICLAQGQVGQGFSVVSRPVWRAAPA